MLKYLRFTLYFTNSLIFTLTDLKSISARVKKRCFCFDLFCFCYERFFIRFLLDLSCCMFKFLSFSVYFANLLDFTLTDVKSMSARYKKLCFCFDLFCFWCMEDFCPKNWNISTCNPYI